MLYVLPKCGMIILQIPRKCILLTYFKYEVYERTIEKEKRDLNERNVNC